MKFTGTLLNLDGQPDSSGEIFSPDTEIAIHSNGLEYTPVMLDFKTPVGQAILSRNEKSITYEMEIDEAALTPGFAKLLTPSIYGSLKKREGMQLLIVDVHGISLTVAANADSRIKKLGEE